MKRDHLAKVLVTAIAIIVFASFLNTLFIAFTKTRSLFSEAELTRQQLEDLRVRAQWVSEASDRTLQLLASTTLPPEATKEEEYLALVFTAVQKQLAELAKDFEEQAARVDVLEESQERINARTSQIILNATVANLTKRIASIEEKQLTRWDIAKVFLTLMGGMGVLIAGISYIAFRWKIQ